MTETDTRMLPYDLLGGEQGVRDLCKAFYQIMDEDENASTIRAMHHESMDEVEQKLFEYLSGWMGGPHLYLEKYGTICLTTVHEHVRIDEQARDEWLYCMHKALDQIGASDRAKALLKQPMYELANFMRNTERR